jgi:hypothetical protein
MPGMVIVQNSCDYDVWVIPVTKYDHNDLITWIPASSSWTYDLVGTYNESDTGPCLKVSTSEIKEKHLSAKHLQLEVSYKPNADFGPGIWYDLSFEACSDLRPDGGADCPGWEKGLRVTSGKQLKGEDCDKWECKPREYCPKQVYWYHGYDEAGKSACSGCPAKEGVLFELCYSNREGQTQMGSA